MRFLIAIVFVLTFCLSAFGERVIVDGLTDVQAAELKLQAEQLKAQAAHDPVDIIPDAEKLQEYALLGEQIARAIGAAAKETGVAVNEFVKTPVGKLTTFIIVYKLIGRDIMHYICGVGFFILAWFGLSHICGKKSFKREIIYGDKGQKNKVLYNQFLDREEKESVEMWRVAYLIGFAVILGISLIIFWT